MKQVILLCMGLLVAGLFGCQSAERSGEPRVLVFSKTEGFHHQSIPSGIAAIQKLGAENGFAVDTTTNAERFNEADLDKYAAVIFLSTTGDVLNTTQEVAFERYIQAGGAYVGVHAAADTEYSWRWYGKLAGGYFLSHPRPQEARFVIKDRDFPATSFFTDSIWVHTDELYNYKMLNPDVNVVMTIDESSYEGGANGDYHPMAWYHEYDGGRAFYTAVGHTDEAYQEEEVLKHLLGGIQYAMGDNLKLDYSKATSEYPPDADRFSKHILAIGEFYEPTEMAILPNKDVLISQRRGELLHYSHETGELRQIAKLDVYHQSGVRGVNAEEGFMGLQRDPDFENNHWIYAYYSPTGDEWVNRLSRFKFEDGVFDLDSEQVILDVESQRLICCHTGGSIAFGPDGLLYLSTGDNSTPFDEPNAKYVNEGFAPLNDEPGKKQYDARRSSGNTNDLRGKVIRIRVLEDGSYEIPEGNLFPEGMEKTRPEIYTMGHRNPYRISIDQKNSFLYWGDVGPDADEDRFDTRGPRGYDEVGQAREAGNFGWPMFIANNLAYVDYDYRTGESGAPFDAAAPINDSRNNTGLRELPPAQSAFIYYPYNRSNDFPGVGTGGRNAMAGPVYYNDLYSGGENELPEYFNGKLITYDWIRGWMKAITMYPNGDFKKMEPFAPEIQLNNLIDMEVADDGTIYLLEYGRGWFAKNPDAALSFIEYNGGNRPPVLASFETDEDAGPAPLTVNLKVEATDRDEDEVTYHWDFGDGNTAESKDPSISHTYEQPGQYFASVEVTDPQDATVKSEPIMLVSGNSRPEVSVEINGGNSSFFIPGMPLEYKVTVHDAEDDATGIDPANLFVAVDYMEGFDEAALSTGHQQVSMAAMGKNLTQGSDCAACHKENDVSIGPSFAAIAEKYAEQDDAAAYLQHKIMTGSSGVWGEVAMPAHPDLSAEDASQMVMYIQSLSAMEAARQTLPPSGTITPDAGTAGKTMVLTATYTDKGAEGTVPLTGVKRVALSSSQLTFKADLVTVDGFQPMSFGEMNFLATPREGGWFALKDIDLTGVRTANIMAIWQAPPPVGMELEVRLDSPEGDLIGKGKMPAPGSGVQNGVIPIKFSKAHEGKVKELYFVYKPADSDKLGPDNFVGLSTVSFGR